MTSALIASLFVFGHLIPGLKCQVEYFKNPGMEDPDIIGAYGHAWGYSMVRVTDSHSGTYAVKLSNRTQYWMGIGQEFSLKENTLYKFHAYIKLLNNNTKLWQRFSFDAAYQWTNDSHDIKYLEYATHAFGTVEEGWFKISGDVTTPSRSWYHLRIYIQGPDPGVEFLVDDMSLQEVQDDSSRRLTQAAQSIEQIRKNNFSLSVDVADTLDPHFIELEVTLKNHAFAFGTVVSDEFILSPEYKTYQNLVYEFFNWATVGSYKWKYNQGDRNHPNYDRSVQATEELKRNGMKVRGHNMFWGVPNNTPDWVKQLTADELKKVIEERIIFMTNITKGKLEHWDVNNELLHGQVFEEMTRDPVYSQKIYSSVHQHDPYPKLFLNDYNVVAIGGSTDDYVVQAQSFKAANCGLYGLGLQSHFIANTAPSPTLMKMRLDKLAAANLPMWITELTLTNDDENVRADWFEDALTIYFAYPSVEGIIFWGFWDHGGTSPSGALVNGNYYSINAAGKRYLDLVKNRWSTNIKTTLTAKQSSLDFRGFYGDYDVIIRYKGKPIDVQHFSLTKGDNPPTIQIQVNGNGDEITIPTPRPTSETVHHVHHVTSSHTEMLGKSTSHTGSNQLNCTTLYSKLSAVGDDKAVDVVCGDDEIMTDCSMRTEDRRSYRDGEYFVFSNGKAKCRAVNAWRSAAPVQAIARCCKRQSLQCTYMKAGPSDHGKEDRIEVSCPGNTMAVDCTSYSYFGKMDGAMTNLSACFAQNDGSSGVFVYAACCQAPSMTCQIRKSASSGMHQGDTTSVSCSAGETLVGCSVFSEDGNTAGSIPNGGGACVGVNGLDRSPGEDSVVAVAVCCT